MSDTIEILLGKAKSVDSVNEDNYIEVEFTQSHAPLLDTTTVGTVDLNERFINERDASNKYRLTLTVNPFCSNVLYNACSEFTINEGSGDKTGDNAFDCITLTDTHKFTLSDGIYGNLTVTSYDLIRNSEYSREDIGVEYHPGMDFFNNHILRNKSYRIVNRPATIGNGRAIFNTISDYFRTPNGAILTKCCRKSVSDTNLRNKHLYDHDDILEFGNGDAITENIREQDGWFGFYNTNTIPAKNKQGEDMDISRAINNKGNCEFVDLYPDRTLYSFVPKYNKFRNRMEYNWDLQITYPYDKCTTYEVEQSSGNSVEQDFTVVQDGTTNALVILNCQYVRGPQGDDLLLFRCATKHNLEIDDHVHIYYNEEEQAGHWHKPDTAYRVVGTGDMKGDYHDYYFYISDTSLLEEIFATPKDGSTYTEWDYIRDYFYAELDTTLIDNFDPDKTYYRNNLVKYNNQIYICVLDYYSAGLVPTPTGGGTLVPYTGTPTHSLLTIDTTYFQLFNDNYVQVYAEYDSEGNALGLTNIPSALDGYIRVGTKTYELYNHDLDMHFFNSVLDSNQFIRQIINNAFKGGDNGDVLPSTNTLWRDYISLRFTKTDGDRDCSYYIRKFKKVPNIKLTNDSNNQPISVDKNFENVSYPLAFSTTIYGDAVSQSVVTDTIDISGLTGSNGQDVKEIYLTIIKANRGYKEWYLNQSNDGLGKLSSSVEFSHCFGPVTCGFDFFQLDTDSDSIKDKLKAMTDVKYICNDYSGSEQTLGDKTDITIDDDWYYGDIVEFCPWNCMETTLCDVNFRFNTAQRDLEIDNQAYCFQYDEIAYDDYDIPENSTTPDSFEVHVHEAVNKVGNIYTPGVHRPEGYYYKPHYSIKLKGYTNVYQNSHNKLSIFKVEPVQMSGMYLKVTTVYKHNIKSGRVLLRDDTGDYEWWLNIISIVDEHTFIIDKISRSETSDRYRDWITVCENLNNGDYTLLSENTEIPEYATKVSKNTYVWRKTVLGSDVENIDTDVPEFVFANGHHYIDKTINFYLKRQDPSEITGLYYNGQNIYLQDTETLDNILAEPIADTVSEVVEEKTEYEYKDEKMTLC